MKLLQTLNRLSKNPLPVNLPPSGPHFVTAPLAVITTAPPAVIAERVNNSTGSTITAPPAVITTAPPPIRGKKIYHCTQAQDGHSANERLVYDILWAAGHLGPEGDRIASLSVPVIAKKSGIHERNIPVIIHRLAGKLALELLPSAPGAGRIYRVYPYSKVLRLRLAAGFQWVIRGRGIEFVHPETGQVLPLAPPAVITTAPPAVITTAPPAVTAGAVIGSASLLELNLLNREITTTSSDPYPLMDAIDNLALSARVKNWRKIDEPAGKRLEAIRLKHEASVDEAAWLFVERWKVMESAFDNPIGAFLKQPDLWITPRTLEDLRHTWETPG
jgi:hypothetical protein